MVVETTIVFAGLAAGIAAFFGLGGPFVVPILIGAAVLIFLLFGVPIFSLITFLFIHPFLSILFVAGIFGILYLIKK